MALNINSVAFIHTLAHDMRLMCVIKKHVGHRQLKPPR